jgi:proton-dependent oligopeptide transporter, POT family
MIFYLCINVGSLSLLATPYIERNIDFWPAYLLGFCMFIVGFIVLVLGRKSYIVRPPQGSIIINSFKVMGMMIRKFNQDAAKPSYIQHHGGNSNVPWTDHFVEEVKRALTAMKVFVFFPVFWVIYGQFSNNFVSQGELFILHKIHY